MKKTIETKKVASVKEAIEIINRLNYRNDTFEYSGYTREDDADVKYRHFDSEKGGFAIIKIVVDGKLEVVRFFNLYRNITVDIKLGDFNPDYSRYDEVVDADGTPIAYYVNGKRTRKANIEFYYAKNPAYNGLIVIDHYAARYVFPDVYYNKSKVVFTNWADTGKTIATKAAAEELGLRLVHKVSLSPEIYLVEENAEADPAEYAVAPEAMEVAIKR